MRFAEAEQQYRELEEQLFRGELKEEEFAVKAAQLRLIDEEGRRWMISARTGRWLVHDGQQWVFAEPPAEKPEVDEADEAAAVVAAGAVAAAGAAEAAATADAAEAEEEKDRPAVSRMLLAVLASVVLLLCLVGGGVSAWVFVLRDWEDPTPLPPRPTSAALVQTYTPRPATATFTPTPTPTPSRTPTPTPTMIPTDTPQPTDTPPPPPTLTPDSSPTPTWTPLVIAQVTRVTSVATSSPTPGETPSETPEPQTPTPAPPSGETYTVKQGDTLFEIALRYDVSVQALAEANGITNTKLIRPGQVLVIPIPGTTPQAPATSTTPTPTVASTTVAQVTATATPSGPTPTPGPTKPPEPTATPRPTAVPTAKPAALTGKFAFTVWNPYTYRYELYVSLVDGTGRNMIGEGFRQPQFRQDGNLIAVNGEGAPNYEHLVTMNPSGGGLVEVSNHTEDSYPSWSPDGAIVSYSSDSWGDGQIRLGIVHDMFGMQQDWIKVGTTEIRGQYPFWMSDGRVVYTGCDFLGDQAACGLYWVGAGGGNYRPLTHDRSDTAPAGAGNRVAFMSSRDGNWEVYRINMDGTGLKRLTNDGAQDGLPTWSPDGKSIAFVSSRGGVWAIWVMNADGSNQRKLFDLGGGYGSGATDWTTERISWGP